MITIPNTPTGSEYFALGGGLDQRTPAIRVSNGGLLDVSNYEPEISGGYRRTGGYERFDGHARPSDASVSYVACTLTSTLVAGDALTIGAATCVFLRTVTGGMAVTKVIGTIPASTTITSGGSVGTTASDLTTAYSPTAAEYAQDKASAADEYRTDISGVPGSGSVLGVFWWGLTAYAFRNNVGGTAAALYKSSASGWTQVTMPYELPYTAGRIQFSVGDTVRGVGSAATGTVAAIVTRTGEWADSDAAGVLIITGVSGTFSNGEALRSSSDSYTADCATCAGTATQVTLSPGGTYKMLVHNFYGQQASTRIYGVDGVNRAFEFDGTTYIPISTGATGDTPSSVSIHANRLALALDSSLMLSAPGDPFRWSVVDTAQEFAVGSTIADLLSGVADATVVGCENKLVALYGSSTTDFVVKTINPSASVQSGSMASLGQMFFLGGQGVQIVSAVQEYGNLASSSVSFNIQDLINDQRDQTCVSCVVRSRNQYRVFWADGRVLVMLSSGGSVGGFTVLDYPFSPTCVTSEEDSNGVERILVGGDDGMVYELNRGSSFDGATITARFTTVFNHSKSPRALKRYRRLAIEMTAELYSPITIQATLSYGDASTRAPLNTTLGVSGGGGLWDQGTWDEIFYDSQIITQPTVRLTGTGANIAFSFSQDSSVDQGHVIQGLIVHHSMRRNLRA